MINSWTAKDRAWIADDIIVGAITGIRFDFHGLGCAWHEDKPNDAEREFAAQGTLTISPYYGPWSWMNREARAFLDELIAKIYVEYGLVADIPLALTGGSMGGGSALIYARYSQHRLAGCSVNCPVCDFRYHFTERPDVARTMHHAFGHYGIPTEEAVCEGSPLHQVAALPDIPYFFIHGDADTAVNKGAHSDQLVPAMRARGLRVEYHEVPGMGHCGPVPEDVSRRERAFLREVGIQS